MITPPPGTRIWIAAGVTDLRRGFDGLAALVQTRLEADPFSGHIFAFRGRRGNRIKLPWWDGEGLCRLNPVAVPRNTCSRACKSKAIGARTAVCSVS
jgi:transposase